MRFLLLLGGALLASLTFAGDTFYFEGENDGGTTRIILEIDGDEVRGLQAWDVPEAHGTRGSLKGKREEGGILQLVHRYTIEGSDQAEEVICKLADGGLLIGEGELKEDHDGVLRLKDPESVKFTRKLAPVVVSKPAPGTPERKEIMDVMRGPISAYIGSRVKFTGEVRTCRGWGVFSGDVATEDGKPVTEPEASFALEMDYMALLKKDPDGRWQILDWGFSGDIGVYESFQADYPGVPWFLLP